ncbi:unnamed protein product [Meloidogyne enterolobii]|uniref:Uncharacterized protein n=1 Tax=Meloidogyne enterolobii TaxID=390850 RepID=A0ACB0YGD6_MELEN
MSTWQKIQKSSSFSSFFISLLLLVALLFMASSLPWYGNCYSLSDSSEVSSIRDYRSLPVESPLDVDKLENYLNERSLRLGNMINTSFAKFVKGIPAKDGNWCERMGNGKLDSEEHKKLEGWAFADDDKTLFAELAKSGEVVSQRSLYKLTNMKLVILFLRCTRLKEKFPFIDEPLSEEEKEFPLAYGILVYKSAFQVYMMMSAIYHPQNIYCVSIDEKSTKEFKDSMLLLTDCFPNIFVMVGFNLVQKIILKASVNPVGWCEFGVARSLYNCFRYLTEHKHDWKYFQVK